MPKPLSTPNFFKLAFSLQVKRKKAEKVNCETQHTKDTNICKPRIGLSSQIQSQNTIFSRQKNKFFWS